MTKGAWTVSRAGVEQPEAAGLLYSYYDELVSRYWGRPCEAGEVESAMRDEPNDDLAVFLVARVRDAAAGCVGVRMLAAGLAELSRMYIRPEFRRSGGGRLLLAAADQAAEESGARAIRLDTRDDLVEARAMYARCGYREIPAYNDSRYADHWFEKAPPSPRI
ncbi:GNAT family N-acetyltransferase [Catenulispora sp. NL8]|uniref:GNAT family N-acetyltransferase n=1 Tax=Catenulispora pinistramenti TaxID=2705254 RepID=A0ABS5KST9_9ACTN|nr:GNAT family N-acetyltransferase [Catenulispora pinistramenti]MBS2549070.1 GNAT family N-acetyltransferase [Catenulispora pinistramenti]